MCSPGTEAFITKNNYKPPGKYSNNQQRNRSLHKSNIASNDQSLNRKFDLKQYTPNSSQICLGFNCYSEPFCTLENDKCKYGRQHKCSLCNKPGCRALNHNLQPRTHANLSSSTGDYIDESIKLLKLFFIDGSQRQCRTYDHSRFRHPAPIIARFYPAMVNAFPSSVHQSGLDLANRNILWTSVTSAGIKILLTHR